MTMTMHSDYHYVACTVPHVLYSEYDAICPICPICLTRASMPYIPHMTEYSEYRTLYSQDAYPLALCLELAAKASGSLWYYSIMPATMHHSSMPTPSMIPSVVILPTLTSVLLLVVL